MSRRSRRLRKHLEQLSRYSYLLVDELNRFVIVRGVKLPPGFDRSTTDVLIELPADYPISPPGVGNSQVFVLAGLSYHRRKLADVYEKRQPSYPTLGLGPWAWFCYQKIKWNPARDNLVGFIEMLRADLTNPSTL